MRTVPDAATLPREPRAHAAGRYAAAVLGLMGLGPILNTVVGAFTQPMTWGWTLGFSLFGGGIFASSGGGSPEGRFQRRDLAPFALPGLALFVLVGFSAKGVYPLPAPTGILAIVAGAVALAISAVMTTRLSRHIHTDPDPGRTQTPSQDSQSA